MRQKERVKKVKRWVSVLLLSIAPVWAGGCQKEIDPRAYTQAVLDASYKNETAAYAEMTGISEEKAGEVFYRNLDAAAEAVDTAVLTEEQKAQYEDLFENMIMQVRYTVGDSSRLEDGSFAVEVTVEPMLIFDDTYEQFQKETEAYAERAVNRALEGEELPAEKEMKRKIYEIYYDILNVYMMRGIRYGAPEKIIIHILKTEESAYIISEEDIHMLDKKLISREKLDGTE